MTSIALGDIVGRLGGQLIGDATLRIQGVAPLDAARAGQLSFLANPKYRAALDDTAAAAVIVKAGGEYPQGRAYVLADDPYLYFARALQLFHPPPAVRPGVHATATVDATIPASVEVGPSAVIEAGAAIGEDVVIGAGCFVGAGVQIGRGTRLMPRVTVYGGCRIGEDCLIHAGAVIGADGFGFARRADGSWEKIPQIGIVRIGNAVEIGANTTIDRGALGDTVIGDGVKLDNQIQIAHNVTIGEHTAMAAFSGVAGSTRIGARCMIGGQAGISGHLTIADDVVVSACTLVSKSIRSSGSYTGNLPQQSHAEWMRNFAHLRHLDKLAAKIRELEKRLDMGETES